MKSLSPAIVGTLAALALAGCAGMPVPPDTAATHPANPHADTSPVPPLQPDLLTITNLVTVKPLSDPAPEDQHEHGQEKPPTKEGK